MIGKKLEEILKRHPDLKEKLWLLEDSFAKKEMTDKTLHLMATQIQILFQNYGYKMRIICQKNNREEIIIKLIPEEELPFNDFSFNRWFKRFASFFRRLFS